MVLLHLMANFNSIKVRLEHNISGIPQSKLSDFNSIKVRLELFGELTAPCADLHFNSIKVRLEQPKHRIVNKLPVFQFHKGAIRTHR